jgi:hypothetical protein
LSYREIESAIEIIEKDGSLGKEENFVARAEAIDFIEFHVIARIGDQQDLIELKQRAESLKNRLEEINDQFFTRLRASIRSGSYTCEGLRRQFCKYAERASRDRGPDDIDYDAFDTFVNDLLRIDLAPVETKEREPDMVFLQPTPARIVLELVERIGITTDDIFYDLGSGLGQVAILVGLLSGAKTKGIEFEPAYCDYARRCAEKLNLSRVEFANVDARDADYSDGTIFFMYTPFGGSMLQEVLEGLWSESQKRTIRICTYGPCTPRVSEQTWLRRIDQNPDHEYALAIFRSE